MRHLVKGKAGRRKMRHWVEGKAGRRKMRHCVEGKAGTAFLALHCSWILNLFRGHIERKIKSQLNSKVWCMCMQVRTLVYCQYTVGAWEKNSEWIPMPCLYCIGRAYIRNVYAQCLLVYT